MFCGIVSEGLVGPLNTARTWMRNGCICSSRTWKTRQRPLRSRRRDTKRFHISVPYLESTLQQCSGYNCGLTAIWLQLSFDVTSIWLWFGDSHLTACQRLLGSQWLNPIAAGMLTCLPHTAAHGRLACGHNVDCQMVIACISISHKFI